MKEAIDVIIRARPTAKFAHESILIDAARGEITIKKPKKKEDGPVNHQQDTWNYRFNKIFLNETQSSFFEKNIQGIIAESLSGVNTTVLAYGQTGAGKTFTISGSQEDSKYRGILPRTLIAVFHQISLLTSYHFKIRMTYVEIHNENLRDLLVDEACNNIVLQDDAELGVFPQGALMLPVRNEEEALLYMFRGDNNKNISEHKLNKTSSRSHTVLTLYIESRSKSESVSKISFSKLSIFDLAGCERTKKTNSEGFKMLEASFINKSLSSLEQLVVAYNHKNRDFLPYRQTKLTYLLKDSIGGNAKTIFIANIWPEESYLEETISVLRFASRMCDISNFVQKNTKNDTNILFKQYEQQIKDLKKELAMHDAFTERKGVNYDFFTLEEQQEQKLMAEKFLNGYIDDIEVKNLRQVKELFSQFKLIYDNSVKRGEDKKSDAKVQSIHSEITRANDNEPHRSKKEVKKVGKDEPQFGFGLGHADLNSKPPATITERNGASIPAENILLSSSPQRQEWGDSLEDLIRVESNRGDKNSLFAIFKDTYGKNLTLDINHTVTELKELKSQMDGVRDRCNSTKSKIETLQTLLKASYPDNYEDEDEDKKKLLEELKSLKHQHAEDLKNHKVYKTRSHELENLLYLRKKKILEAFNAFSLKISTKITINKENLTPELMSTYMKNEREVEEEALFERAKKTFVNTTKALAAEKYTHVSSK